ncbi:ATP-binding protein [Stenotrophomonas rhizophila]|uniref:ATP-binding protein n=1 Tax=Stenotrophomonas rhizophila TaxID=216778 RepID=UPI001E2BFACA|nr:ATP-binding protein [Stenotrophomonas rhizophila]MCC7632516.1 two-component sensor histidine kinase [Stenotrophomonas rhizophila]MCC7663368.1 two-component sensor histidine kinase [Stenotrophomonas rhizophila]
MTRLFLRLWLITSACFVLSVLGLNLILDRFYSPRLDQVFVQQIRGQVYALRDGLAGRSIEQQRRQLARWQPHYGIGLALLDTPPVLDAAERAMLLAQGFVARDTYQWVLLPVDADDGRWLSLRLPGEVSMTMHMTVLAYLGIVALLGASIFIWVRLLWRDLEILRGHADRIGAGDLHARAKVSPRSQIRVIVEHSNRMAARVADLVQGQRDLTHAVSHELRTPVARLAFGLDLVEQASDERRTALLHGMRSDLAELNRLVSELLAYERLEHRGESCHWPRVDALPWLQQSLADPLRQAAATGIGLALRRCEPACLHIDGRLMQLALSNLVCNALRHARSQVQVSLLQIDGACCLRVDDDGEGIAEADRVRVLQPFTRLDDSRSRDTGGFGLGLAIVRRIAERHGGQAVVSRASLGGARLEIRWPCAPA